MPRGPATNPIPKLPTWQKRPICGECGLKIRRPRPDNEKRCSRCREVLDVSEFTHNTARADHRESYCRPCRRVMQNEANRKQRLRGKAQSISDLSPVGEQTSVLIGSFVSQGLLSEWKEVPSSIKPVRVEYRTVEDRQDVYELTLQPVHRPTGTPADHVSIPHTFKELFDALLLPGDWLACVFQDGQLEKVIRSRGRAADHRHLPRFHLGRRRTARSELRLLRPSPSVEPPVGCGVHPRRQAQGERLSPVWERTGRRGGLHVVLSRLHSRSAVLGRASVGGARGRTRDRVRGP